MSQTRYLRERTLFDPLIQSAPPKNLGLAVVIPARDEGESLIRSLQSLRACESANGGVEVIVVVNTSETDSAETVNRNRISAEKSRQWANENSSPKIQFHILETHDLPRKHAGVGLARKIGMDEACRRFETVENPRGVIACFDADSQCDSNYFVEIESLFRHRQKCQACSIYFEHPLEGNEFPAEIHEAIIDYELHLRTYIHAQRFAGFPFAVQTIGSSMAVRCDAYQAQNGMNRRQAGEDFYFLHKFTPLGPGVVEELCTTRVIPSPRVSHRVPFGTGKAVGDRLRSGEPGKTYAPRSFLDLREFLSRTEAMWETDSVSLPGLPPPIHTFLEAQDFERHLAEIRKNVTTLPQFRTRFFRWFNAFLVMKYLHHARDGWYPDVPVAEAASWLLEQWKIPPSSNSQELLNQWRKIDRTAKKPATENVF